MAVQAAQAAKTPASISKLLLDSTVDMVVVRNAYGRQLDSFYDEGEFNGIGKIPMTFIRAPYIQAVSNGAEVLARSGGHIVAARQGNPTGNFVSSGVEPGFH